jgi:hypothetical protein
MDERVQGCQGSPTKYKTTAARAAVTAFGCHDIQYRHMADGGVRSPRAGDGNSPAHLASLLGSSAHPAARGELLSSPRYRDRTRVKHGDQFQDHSGRPDQADRDHDDDNCRHPLAHFASPVAYQPVASWPVGRDTGAESNTTGTMSHIVATDHIRPTATTTPIVHASICIP